MDHQPCRSNQPRRRVALLLRKDHQLTKMAAVRVTARKAPIVGSVGVMETAKQAIPLKDQKTRATATQAPAAAGGRLWGSGGSRGAGCGGAEAELGCGAAAAGVGLGGAGRGLAGRQAAAVGRRGKMVGRQRRAVGRRALGWWAVVIG